MKTFSISLGSVSLALALNASVYFFSQWLGIGQVSAMIAMLTFGLAGTILPTVTGLLVSVENCIQYLFGGAVSAIGTVVSIALWALTTAMTTK